MRSLCEIVVPPWRVAMRHWREVLFSVMPRNAGSVAAFLRLPDNCIVELGTRVRI